MKIETRYTFNNVKSSYVNYSNELEFTNGADDTLTIPLDESHLESLKESIEYRLEKIKERRLEKMKEDLENANSDS